MCQILLHHIWVTDHSYFPSSHHHFFHTHIIKFHPLGKFVNLLFHLLSPFLLSFIHCVLILHCVFWTVFLYISCETTLHTGKYDNTWTVISLTTLKFRHHILFAGFHPSKVSGTLPCHQVSVYEGGCIYNENTPVVRQKWVVLQLWGWLRNQQILTANNQCYKILCGDLWTYSSEQLK